MQFNSFEFIVFFLIVYALYLLLKHRWQNLMLLCASYVFYAAWDWRFLGLIWMSTLVDYFCGHKIAKSVGSARKQYLYLSLVTNLGILGFFKYFGFFSEGCAQMLAFLGFEVHAPTLNILLPVGISFYTFQTMSYTIDIYRREYQPTKRFWDFALFVAFFPQLVAGPIERAKRLLPQILTARVLNLKQIYEGGFLILWGFFQKIFVADNLARIVETVFDKPGASSGVAVWLALYAFAFQIYGDFAGYSNIARGLAKLMGFELMVNFRCPYFSESPSEVWRRWHISLSSWLRDYVYRSFGGNKKGGFKTYRNLALTMLLGGLWHGAGWTYLLWGAYHAALLSLYASLRGQGQRLFGDAWSGPVAKMVRIIVFFHLWCLGLLIFRASSVVQISQLASSFGAGLSFSPQNLLTVQKLIGFTGLLIGVEMMQYYKRDLLCILKFPVLVRAAFYVVVFYSIVIFGFHEKHAFIYFQF